jgi:hypothetical protein
MGMPVPERPFAVLIGSEEEDLNMLQGAGEAHSSIN